MLTSEEIKKLVCGGEGYNVDFKRTVPQKVKDLTEEVCSFANANGGFILIGVDDDNRIVGCEIDNAKRSAIYNSIGEIDPALHFNMYPRDVDGKTVWVIDIPNSKQKPHFYGGSTYIREGANSLKVTKVDEIREIFKSNNQIFYDEAPAPKVQFYEELDADNLREFRQEAGYSNSISDEQILENLQVFNEDGIPLRGGVLFFNREPEKYYFHAVIRCVLFKGTNKIMIIDDKTFGGPLIQQYKKAMQWLQSKLQLSYVIEGAGPRKEVWEIPMAVFKEAIINAIAHRDYYEHGATITIEMFDDRVEITNPGGLLPIVAKNFGRKSLSRNPLIFGLLTRMHLVEHIGSGIPRMEYEMCKVGLPKPIFETEGMFTVTFMRPVGQDYAPMMVANERDFPPYYNTQIMTKAQPYSVSPKDTVSGDANALTEFQKRIIDILGRMPKATMEEVAAMLNVSRTTIATNIRTLREQGIVSRHGRKSDGSWVISNNF
jgi:ATP-dependent DNA helicase RecG